MNLSQGVEEEEDDDDDGDDGCLDAVDDASIDGFLTARCTESCESVLNS